MVLRSERIHRLRPLLRPSTKIRTILHRCAWLCYDFTDEVVELASSLLPAVQRCRRSAASFVDDGSFLSLPPLGESNPDVQLYADKSAPKVEYSLLEVPTCQSKHADDYDTDDDDGGDDEDDDDDDDGDDGDTTSTFIFIY